MRILHWLIGIAVILIIASGISMKYYVEPPLKYEIYGTHKAIGITILALMIVRIIVRFFTMVPKMPVELSKVEKLAAKITHYMLYLFVFIVAISGYIMSSASGKAISWFDIFNVPLLVDKNQEIATIAHSVHTFMPYILISLIVLHILATLKHWIIDKVNILRRIV